MVSQALYNAVPNRGIKIFRTLDDSIAQYVVTTVRHYAWDNNDEGFFYPEYQGRIWIPGGVRKVRMAASISWFGQDGVGERWHDIARHDGQQQACSRYFPTSYSESLITTGVVDVQQGWWFEHRSWHTCAPPYPIHYTADGAVWFALQVVE